MRPLPIEAQFSPIYALQVADFNHDRHLDLLAAGNNRSTRVKFGHYSANHGLVLLGDGQGAFKAVSNERSGLKLRGDVRDVQLFKTKAGDKILLGINEQQARLWSF
jgi:hypothetical protein